MDRSASVTTVYQSCSNDPGTRADGLTSHPKILRGGRPRAHCGARSAWTYKREALRSDLHRSMRPQLPNSFTTSDVTKRHSMLRGVCCRVVLYGIKRAAYGGADVAELVVLLTCRSGRSRLLRAAWRPCSRGSARRACRLVMLVMPDVTVLAQVSRTVGEDSGLAVTNWTVPIL